MLINLTDVFSVEGKDREESFDFEPHEVSYMGNTYQVLEKSPVRVHCSNIGLGKALVQGEADLVLSIPCDRCLKDVKVPVSIKFVEEVFSPDRMQQSEENEEQSFMLGYELDMEALLNSEILVNMPVKVLCKPDCKGICKQCGHDLNEGDCGCDTFVPDPRMAAIKDIFNANKEV
ncbi:MAG: DUF177 domain-containing protein [Bacillota bacterium]|nr:DUF177 domain-containing protein [Bacillota bacterium]